jgi:hypothetical protein
MKPTISLLIAVLILVCGVNESKAQWVQTSEPTSARVYSLAVSSNGGGGTNLFAGTYYGAGVFLSTNNGTSWENAGLAGSCVNALAVSGGNIFAGTDGNGVYLSTNDGTSWNQAGLPGIYVHALAVSRDAAGNANIFAGTVPWFPLFQHVKGGGVYRSNDNGTSWAKVNVGLADTNIHALAVGSNGAGGSIVFAGGDGGVYLSTNNGDTWTPVSNGIPPDTTVKTLVVIAKAEGGNAIFAGTAGGVFLSDNNGNSWTAVNTGLGVGIVRALAVSPNETGTADLFAGTDDGVFLSDNNGSNWIIINKGLPTYAWGDVSELAVSPNGTSGSTVLAGGEAGIYLSWDNGSNWIRSLATYVRITAFAVGPNGGQGTGSTVFAATPAGSSCGWFTGCSSWNGEVFSSTDNGRNWSKVSSPDLAFSVLTLSPSPKEAGWANMFAGTDWTGVYLSTDNGMSWTETNTGLTDRHIQAFVVIPDGKGRASLFAGTYGRGVFLSTNDGTNWSPVNNGLPTLRPVRPEYYLPIGALVATGTNLFAGASSNGGYSGGVYLSTTNGKNWTPVNNGLPAHISVRALAVSGTNVFAGIDSAGVFVSSNNGRRWAAVSDGLPTNLHINALAVGSNGTGGAYLFAGTNRGIWRRPLSEMVTAVKEVHSSLPEGYSLQQNYPNPFNPSTTIRFSLPKSGYVTLKVYDILGREVETLVDGNRTAGAYSVEWTPKNLASGMYLYRIEAGAFSEVKKLLLVR